jgi:transcriptional regulator with XRE-family HTH domain
MHKKLSKYRTIGEYFSYPYQEAVNLLKRLVSENAIEQIQDGEISDYFFTSSDNVDMEITATDIVKRLDQILSEESISQIEACKGAGISDHSITDWKGTKNKKGSMPSADKLYKMANFLKVSWYWLLTGHDESGLTPEQRELILMYDKLDSRDKRTIVDLIEAMLKKH